MVVAYKNRLGGYAPKSFKQKGKKKGEEA